MTTAPAARHTHDPARYEAQFVQDWLDLVSTHAHRASQKLRAYQPVTAEGDTLRRRYLAVLRTVERLLEDADALPLADELRDAHQGAEEEAHALPARRRPR